MTVDPPASGCECLFVDLIVEPVSLVRIAALTVPAHWADAESLPAIQEAAPSGDVAIGKAGKEALERMAKVGQR